jgi:hypothetical protein
MWQTLCAFHNKEENIFFEGGLTFCITISGRDVIQKKTIKVDLTVLV